MNITDYLLETGHDSDLAIIADEGPLTYGALREAVDAVAATLLECGTAKGERVGVFSDNSVFWVSSYLGALKIGAVAVPFYPTLDRTQFEALLALTGPKAFCIQEKYSRNTATHCLPRAS